MRTYSYDANGNRQSATKNGGAPIIGIYDDQDRLRQYGETIYTLHP